MFPGATGKRDYSGFDRSTWEKRNTEDHRKEMDEIRKCTTKSQKESLESKYGTRYSVLTRLEYYDSIRMAIVDPMHNLFSGIYRQVFKFVPY